MKIIWKRSVIYLFLFLLFLGGPIWLGLTGQVDFSSNWRLADRSSANIAPKALEYKPAVIQVYAARAYNWRGLLAVHTWIALKPKDAKRYSVFQVVGWNSFYGLSVLSNSYGHPDRIWFGNRPWIIKDIRGAEAQILIPKIYQAVQSYPYKRYYSVWPGPNSNTFTAFVARAVPKLHLLLPASALGKDYLGRVTFFARVPSNTGYQFSLFGIFGILVAKIEGLEINVLGLTFGVSPYLKAVILPGIGMIQL